MKEDGEGQGAKLRGEEGAGEVQGRDQGKPK